MAARTSTRVAIVGGGPAGLMLSHLLGRAGIESVAVDLRSRAEIESTHRAGILEAGSVDLLVGTGVSDRVYRDGHEHRGVALRYAGASHRVDFTGLVGRSTWLYPQTDVFLDLADARERDGGDVRFAVSDVHVQLDDRPVVAFRDEQGRAHEIDCEVVVGADGSRSSCRDLVPEAGRRRYYREYPFAWFGILCEAPRSWDELIYAHSPRGFALISSRTDGVQRMYFQCSPDEDPTEWSDDRIWDELQARIAGDDGYQLTEGPVIDTSVLPFRSFVQEPLHHRRLVLVGDAGHTVPPTGAKGLNLALADVRTLVDALVPALDGQEPVEQALQRYSARALERVWRCQHFSYWMTTLLHRQPGASDFDERRQLAELDAVTQTREGAIYLADAYTGWPNAPVLAGV